MTSNNASPAASDLQLRAGVARVDITTESSDRGIRDRLYAKVLFLQQGETQVVLVTMDAVAIGGICDITDEFLPALRARVEAELGLPGRQLLVNASHTHPPDRILCEDAELLDRTFGAIRQAQKSLTDVVVGSGAAHEDRITMNRNLKMRDGSHWTVRHANPCPPDDEVVGVGPIDPEIGILRLDRTDGTPLAVVYNFACHLLFADPQGRVTANLPGVASRLIEENWGVGVTAFFLQGAAGDVIDVTFKDFTQPRDIEAMGTMLGLKVLLALPGITLGNGPLALLSEEVEFPRRLDIPGRIAALGRETQALLESLRTTSLNFKGFLPLYLRQALHPEGPADYSFIYLREKATGQERQVAMDALNAANVRKYLENLEAMEKLARIQDEIATYQRHLAINKESHATTITAEIQGIRIGDCALISAPLELLTEVGLNVKAASPFSRTLVAAFSNGYMHYGPPAADYDKGGYEVIECFLAPEWQQIFEDKAADLLRRL